MLHDEKYMNIYTGEVLPATKAINQYYSEKKRGCLDDWQEEWIPTGRYSDELITPPDFRKALNV